MRSLRALAFLWLAPAVHASRATVQTVDGARMLAAARAVMSSEPASRGTVVSVRPLGRVADAVVPAGRLVLRAGQPAGPWPRSRVAVPVVLWVNGRAVRTESIWFAVTATRQVLVAGDGAIQGTAARSLKSRLAAIDVASVHGHPVQTVEQLAGLRLKQGVRKGSPLLREDFEAIPDVDARGKVTVLVRLGAIRMQTRGTALSAGNAGQTISVLADGAESPVRATVQSKGVVQVAR